jgi:hypothetical protein
MEVVIVDRKRLAEAALGVVNRVADLVRDLPDTNIPIPNSDWTVGEAAAHLAYTNIGFSLMARGMEVPHGDGTIEGFADANEVSLMGFVERDGAVLAHRLADGARLALEEAQARPAGLICPTPMGRMPVAGLMSYLLTHNLMHGCAIAEALEAPYPYERGNLEHTWPFLNHAFGGRNEPTADGALAQIELKGGDELHFTIAVTPVGLVVVSSPDEHVDCVISADPLTLFLVLMKLLPLDEAVDRGSMVLEGPNPQAGSALIESFQVP